MSEFLFIALLALCKRGNSSHRSVANKKERFKTKNQRAKSQPWLKGINHTGKKVDLKELDLDKSCIISWNILYGI